MDNLWTNKYKPSNISEIIGNKLSISKIDEWLEKFNSHNNNATAAVTANTNASFFDHSECFRC